VKNLKRSIGALDGDVATRLATTASDITLMVGRDGIVKDLSIVNESLAKDTDIGAWVGRRWIDTVTIESKPKIEQLLKDASSGATNWRQVNHPSLAGRPDLPVRYATMMLRPNGPFIALGRELRSVSVIQQKLLEAQQAVEREYARVRQAEMRYRLLFQMSIEACVILDAATLRITDINPAAQRLLGALTKRVAGKTFTEFFEGPGQANVQRLVDSLRTSGQADAVTVRLGPGGADVRVSGSMFRQEGGPQLLVQLAPVGGQSQSVVDDSTGSLKLLVERIPDAFVMTDSDLRILTGNEAFLNLTQQAAPDQIKGQPIDRWVGRSSAEVNLLVASLRDYGSVRRFPTIVRGELGVIEDVEISAVLVENAAHPNIGLAIRTAGPSATVDGTDTGQLPYTTSQLKGLVGQVPLKQIVRETTDLIERMCIEAALQIVGDNRASAAEMLGVSRQSLYLKLRRYGLGDLDNAE
jgi:transcriptional regulator PpsR